MLHSNHLFQRTSVFHVRQCFIYLPTSKGLFLRNVVQLKLVIMAVPVTVAMPVTMFFTMSVFISVAMGMGMTMTVFWGMIIILLLLKPMEMLISQSIQPIFKHLYLKFIIKFVTYSSSIIINTIFKITI